MLNVFKLNVASKPFMLSVIMQNVIMLNVVMLNVVAPFNEQHPMPSSCAASKSLFEKCRWRYRVIKTCVYTFIDCMGLLVRHERVLFENKHTHKYVCVRERETEREIMGERDRESMCERDR
jgi:hypothetical protein